MIEKSKRGALLGMLLCYLLGGDAKTKKGKKEK